MIRRSVLRLSAAATLGACAVAPALAQSVPLPLPRPPQLRQAPQPPVQAQIPPAAPVVAVPVAAAPVAPIPAAPAPAAVPTAPAPAEIPAPPAMAVAEPMTPAQTGAAPSPSTSEDTPDDAASTAALTPSDSEASAEPGAPLDLAQPQPPPLPLPPPSNIQPAPGAGLAAASPAAPTDKNTLGKVNSYFNSISTLVGNFTQIGPDGSRADGKFFLMKPGKVRFYYQRPSTTDIIADGKSLVVRDRKLATQDVYPLNQTPLKFLLDKNLDLARDSKVIAVYEEPGLVSVALEEETTFGGKARILIVFGSEDGKKYELKQWTITDPQGLNTTVALSELDTATKPDDKLFAVDYTRDIRRN